VIACRSAHLALTSCGRSKMIKRQRNHPKNYRDLRIKAKARRFGTDRPAAKMLLAFPPLTSTAVTGPGSWSGVPSTVHVVFEKLNWTTFDIELSDNAMDPDAISSS
jgi:hypothetical protein